MAATELPPVQGIGRGPEISEAVRDVADRVARSGRSASRGDGPAGARSRPAAEFADRHAELAVSHRMALTADSSAGATTGVESWEQCLRRMRDGDELVDIATRCGSETLLEALWCLIVRAALTAHAAAADEPPVGAGSGVVTLGPVAGHLDALTA